MWIVCSLTKHNKNLEKNIWSEDVNIHVLYPVKAMTVKII